MSRIRSLHPGLFTDEQYMALSFPARELIKGIWCECDDQGAFEWKPLTLKAKIMPADAVDMPALLDELVRGKFVTKYDYDGRSYGAVRNFRRFQRPKKPNSIHLLPSEFRTYVGLSADEEEHSAEQPPSVPHQLPTEGEKPPQMEDEGRRVKGEERKKDSEPNGSDAASASPMDLKAMVFRTGLHWLMENTGEPERKIRSQLGGWCKEFGDGVVLEAISAAQHQTPNEPMSWIIRRLKTQGKPRLGGNPGGYIPMHPGAGG